MVKSEFKKLKKAAYSFGKQGLKTGAAIGKVAMRNYKADFDRREKFFKGKKNKLIWDKYL